MLADPSVFSPETSSSLRCKAIFARNFLPVILPSAVLQLLHVRNHRNEVYFLYLKKSRFCVSNLCADQLARYGE